MSFQVVPETQRCSDCGNLVPSANFALHAGRCRGPSPAAAAEDESSHASKKAKAEFAVPADAQQVDLTNSDDDDEGAGNAALNAAQIAGAVLRTFTYHTDRVWCLALLPDGLRFVSGSDDKTARIVEIGALP